MSEVISRRERREQMREQRHHQRPHRQAPGPRKARTGLWVALGVVAALVALVYIAQATGFLAPGAPPVDLEDPKYDPAGQVIGAAQDDLGAAHIPAGQSGSYQAIPPTSGEHWAQPAAPTSWGIKDTELPAEVFVHNLEHGGIVILHKGLTADELRQLRDLVVLLRQNGYNKIVMQPYSKLTDARIAVTAWQWLDKLPTYDDVEIVKFIRAHYDGPDAPERGVR